MIILDYLYVHPYLGEIIFNWVENHQLVCHIWNNTWGYIDIVNRQWFVYWTLLNMPSCSHPDEVETNHWTVWAVCCLVQDQCRINYGYFVNELPLRLFTKTRPSRKFRKIVQWQKQCWMFQRFQRSQSSRIMFKCCLCFGVNLMLFM